MKIASKILIIVTLLLVVTGLVREQFPAANVYAAAQAGSPALVAPDVQASLRALPAGQMLSVIVTLKDQEDLSRFRNRDRRIRQTEQIRAMRNRADTSQRLLKVLLQSRQLQGRVSHITPFWVFNGLEVTATADVIQELALRPEVLTITPNATVQAPAVSASSAPPEQNLTVINAPALWNLGFTGQGVVVANMDTGVDYTHPDLAAQWRGGSNSWFDPNGQHATPTDLSGHGTETMGVMVGRDAGGSSIGVAPGAQWIAVKIFNDAGSATVAGIHSGFQWLLDPDGNPATADAPDVVNNSWSINSSGCNLEFRLDVQALQNAGIVPVFAAGNYGPAASTNVSPANYPESLAVGAINNNSAIYAYSSRGPSACGETSTVYPEIVAPGVNIYTTERYGLYNLATGTSLAAPHVAGGLALLLSAFPNLTVAQQKGALLNSAVDLGVAGPDNTFGYGRLNLLAAYQSLAGGNPTATPTNTPIPPTATNTPVPPTNTPVPPTATNTPVPPTNTPVPPTATNTPVPPTNTPIPPTATNTPVPPTNTPVPPTATNTPVPPTATNTPVPPTNTPIPPTATNTPVPPTNTPIPPTATNTPVPPTNTPVPPTATNTPVPPTNTPIPPTATATPVPPTNTPIPPTATNTSVPTPLPESDLIFADSFESGALNAWSAVVDQNGDLAVSSAAALVGGNGLAMSMNNSGSNTYLPFVVKSMLATVASKGSLPPAYLRDDSPQSEARYRARFYFDPNSIALNNGTTHRIFTARSASVDVVVLDFRRSNNTYQLRAGLRTDGGKTIFTGWYTLSDAPHAVEFDWQAATGAGANNGYLSLWLDSVLQQTRSGIDNDTLRIDEICLGPVTGISGTVNGAEYFDDFVSHRANPIGP